MNRRSQPPLALPHSPLIFVLAQVRIAAVLVISEKIPIIQEALRKQGFPRFRRRQTDVVKPQVGPITQIERRDQWEFGDKDNTASVLVDAESIVLQASEYTVFESFMERLEVALNAVAAAAEPSVVERIGLRYVDLIVPRAGKALSDYVRPSLLCEANPHLGSRLAFLSESIAKTGDHSKFLVRFVDGFGGFAFPPDLLPVSLHLRQDPNRGSSRFGMLDMDHFDETTSDFSVESISDRFWGLHEVHSNVFKTSVTEAALAEWSQS